MLQLPDPADYVVSSGETHSVREFVEKAFFKRGIQIEWSGEGDKEVGRNTLTGDVVVMVDPAFYRPTEVDALIGDSSLFRAHTSWIPEYTFKRLVECMVDGDLK
jgi:GDPmannose 4,6-dehydratase